MLNSAYNTIKKYNMLAVDDTVVVGVSGGADSVALLLVLCELRKEYNLKLVAVHVNHSIRGEEADNDEHFVRELCRENDVECRSFKLDVPRYAKGNGLTEEEAGRLLRYIKFNEVALDVGANKIATAHHANDNCETVLHNILRGSGTTGLCGIRPQREKYIRPLIETERKDIEKYLSELNVSFRTDRTNNETLYTRNKIRLELLPYLRKEFNPDVDSALTRLSLLCREEDDFLTLSADKAFEALCKQDKNGIMLERRGFLEEHVAIQRRLIRLILSYLDIPLKDVHLVHIDDCIKLIKNSQSGARLWVGKCFVELTQMGVRFSREPDEPCDYSYELEVGKSVRIESVNSVITLSLADKYEKSDNNTVFISADNVKGTLTVRNRRDGDRITPFGMSGSKKLKDYFVDKKTDVSIRNKIPVIVNNNEVIWIAGMCLSEKYRVTSDTKRILKIQIDKDGK